MSHSVQMPALGESVTEGTVTRWLKNVGDQVEVDEPLLEVSTDKVDTEIPAPYSGVLEKILVGEDETADVGAELAIIGDGSGAAAEPAAAPAPEPEAAPAAEAAPAEAPSTEAEVPAEKPKAATGSAASGTSVKLPEMGESVTEGTVTRWLKAVGDEVAVDEPLVEVSTDKVDTEVPSPVAGTLLEISVGEDETIEVGGQLGIIGDASAAPAPEPEPAPAPAPKAEAPKAQAPKPAAAPPPPAAPAKPVSALPPERVPEGTYVTPVIRKLAADAGVDLASVKGTGVGGRIRREDVQAAAEADQPERLVTYPGDDR
ncbi:biotin/lipoyl-containing protein, partial [Nakamurella sp.]|uniref:biotin/lipoyl-containing protein n=1 Tax=Nakamurella sp. TaxID=1869182 RepID=UPI003B3AF990